MRVPTNNDLRDQSPQISPAQALRRAGTRLVHAAKTGNPQTIRAALENIPLHQRGALLIKLATWVDSEASVLAPRARIPLPPHDDAPTVTLAVLWPQHLAYQHGDRDPAVTNAHHLYEELIAEHEDQPAGDWVDPIAIQRAEEGRAVGRDLTPAERELARAQLEAAKRSAKEVAARLGESTRTTVRHRNSGQVAA